MWNQRAFTHINNEIAIIYDALFTRLPARSPVRVFFIARICTKEWNYRSNSWNDQLHTVVVWHCLLSVDKVTRSYRYSYSLSLLRKRKQKYEILSTDLWHNSHHTKLLCFLFGIKNVFFSILLMLFILFCFCLSWLFIFIQFFHSSVC